MNQYMYDGDDDKAPTEEPPGKGDEDRPVLIEDPAPGSESGSKQMAFDKGFLYAGRMKLVRQWERFYMVRRIDSPVEHPIAINSLQTLYTSQGPQILPQLYQSLTDLDSCH